MRILNFYKRGGGRGTVVSCTRQAVVPERNKRIKAHIQTRRVSSKHPREVQLLHLFF